MRRTVASLILAVAAALVLAHGGRCELPVAVHHSKLAIHEQESTNTTIVFRSTAESKCQGRCTLQVEAASTCSADSSFSATSFAHGRLLDWNTVVVEVPADGISRVHARLECPPTCKPDELVLKLWEGPACAASDAATISVKLMPGDRTHYDSLVYLLGGGESLIYVKHITSFGPYNFVCPANPSRIATVKVAAAVWTVICPLAASMIACVLRKKGVPSPE